MGTLDGKVAVVLGASGEGSMGQATARRFAAEGAKVVVAARRKAPCEKLADELDGVAVQCDIRNDEDLAALAETAVNKYGRLDAAINFAGINSSNAIKDLTAENLRDITDIQFIGPLLFMRYMAEKMTAGGSVILISTLTGYVQPPGLAAYAGTKRGIDYAQRIAAVEYGPQQIRFNTIVPGFVKTEMTAGAFGVPGLSDAFVKETPLGRLGTVDDIADVARFLASDESRMLTGECIQVNGGHYLRRIPTQEEMMAGANG